MKTFVASIIVMSSLAVPALAQQPASVDYRFEEVKRKVMITQSSHESRVEKGQHAKSGDKVQTGWFSYALIASDLHKAKFEIFSSTDVQLSSGTPGVILSLERGRLRAVFDKITGNEPRVVQTPGALLAVRGTQYDVEVDSEGRTTVDVWEGVVAIQSMMLPEPLLVRSGEQSTFGRREIPNLHTIPEDRRRNAPEPRDGERSNRTPRDGPPRGGDPRGKEPNGAPPRFPDPHGPADGGNRGPDHPPAPRPKPPEWL